MNQLPERLYEFGPFRLHVAKRLLLRDGETVPVTSKVFDLLLLLIEQSGQVLHKDQMMKALWPDTVVEENNLTQQISTLRKVLGERANDHHYVVTIPGRGYSFVADVREARAESSDLILEQHIRSLITIDVEEEHDEAQALPHREERKYLPTAVTPLISRRTRAYSQSVAIFVLAGLTAVLAYQWFVNAQRQPQASLTKKSIAVLPFKSLNTGSNDDFLGSGMTDTLIAKLSNIRQMTVRPTSSVIKYVGVNPDTLAAGRELGVDSVLEGTVQRSGDRMRVTVQLLSVRDGQPLWAQSFDETLDDIFAVQDVISEQVAQKMLTKLNGEDQERLRKRYTNSVAAYQAYLKGRYFWNKRNEDNLRKSIEYFQQAIDADPGYAVAYAGMADAYNLLLRYGIPDQSTEENVQRARAAVTRALEIDETLAEAHTSLASIKFYRDRDKVGAKKEYERAIELNPNYATARHWYSECLAMMDQPAEAMAELKRAQELDPLSPIINTTLGERLYYARRYDEAIDQLHKTLEIDPNFYLAHLLLGMAYEQKGTYKEATAELLKAKELSGGNAQTIAALGHAYAVSGRRGEARRMLGELLRLDQVSPYEIATVYIGLGEKRQAFEWLQKEPKDLACWLLNSDPRMASLRYDPRFQELVTV